MRFWLSALIAVVSAVVLSYVWARRRRWPGIDPDDPLASLRTIVEISAILVAGIWTYYHFLKVDEPTLRTNLRIRAELDRDMTLAAPQCLMLVNATVENIGRTEVSIDRIVQRIWRVSDSVLWAPPQPQLFIDLESLTEKNSLPQLSSFEFVSGKSLAFKYVPGASSSSAFPWVLAEMPASETIVARFDFDIDGKPNADFYFTWGKPCVAGSQPSPSVLAR